MIISAAKAQCAAGVLGVELEGLTPDILSKAYRQKAKVCHPDHHGTKELALWSRVSWANDCLKFWLKQRPPEPVVGEIAENACRACSGVGRVPVGTGFRKLLTIQCVMCRGLGTIIPEENDSD